MAVSWEAPANDGGSAITGYKVQWKEAADSWDTPAHVAEDTVTETSHTITELTDGVEYAVRVIATNGDGDGAPSAELRGAPDGAPDLARIKASGGWPDLGPRPGGTYGIMTVFLNKGDAPSAPTTARVYNFTDEPATELATHPVRMLNPGERARVTAEITAPSTAGWYEIRFCVDAVPGESDTSNNCKGPFLPTTYIPERPEQPDLMVYSVSVDNNSLEPGATFTLSATVLNPGEWHSEPTTLRYYKSTDETIATSDTEVGTDPIDYVWTEGPPVHPIIWGTRRYGSIDLAAPSTPGAYYYGACVDAVRDEYDTTDNCSPGVRVTVLQPGQDAVDGGPTVIVTKPNRPDLEVERPTVSDSRPAVGGSFTMFAIVRNIGGGESEATTLRYYQSTDTSIYWTDTLVGTDEVGALAAEGTSAESISLSAPSTPGTYYYGVCVAAVPREYPPPKYDDNCSQYVRIVVPQPTPSNSPASGAPTISGTVQVGETLTASTLGVADADGLKYVSYSYQWVRSDGNTDTDIAEKTYSTYTLDATNQGKTMKVTVFFWDDAGNAETLTSAATGAVAPASGPAVAIGLSPSGSVDEGTEIALTMSFSNLESDSDTSDTDYIFRADVLNADGCESSGMGKDRYMYKVDEDPEVRTGTISAACPPGDYTVEVSISSPGNVELASATADFTVAAPGQQQPPELPSSTDATLSGLTLSGVDFGAFDSTTTGYTASVANGVDETTVAATTNDDGATYAIKLGGVTDDDSVIPLAVGSNIITIEVTAEDGNTAKTYTVTVTRAEPTVSGPAVTVELSPSGSVDEGTEIDLTMSFANLESDSDTSTTDYIFRADVVNADACEGGGMGVDRYMYKVDEEPETRAGVISASCAPGDYTVEVSISSPGNVELASATADFTVTVPGQQQQVQEPPSSTDATLSSLALSNVNFGAFASSTTGYTASVANDVAETTVTPTTNDDGATYEIKLGGVADADRVIPLAVGSNVITVEVTAEDGNTVKTYTVTVTRAAPPSTDATLSGLALTRVDIGAFDPASTGYTASVANDVTQTTVTPTTNDDGATYEIKLGGVADKDGTVPLAVGSNVITVEVTAEDGQATKTYTVTVTRAAPAQQQPEPPSTDATLSALTLSDVNFGNFDPATTSYDVNVDNGVDQTTVTATANDDGSSYMVKLGDVVDEDGTVELSVGANTVSVVVTAEDGNTAKTYTVTVNRAKAPEPESTDEPAPSSPPDVPDTPTGEVIGRGQVKLDWNDVAGAAFYQVRYWDDTEWVELPTDEIAIVIDGSGATISKLPNGSFLYFSVRAGNAAGLSDWSEYLGLPNPEQ